MARIGFVWVRWKSRQGLSETDEAATDVKRHEAMQLGVGKCCLLVPAAPRRHFDRAKFSCPRRQRASGTRFGYDGETLAIVKVRTRPATSDKPALPEMSIGREKRETLVRTAQYFLRERHLAPCPVRFDVVGIDVIPGRLPNVRLEKAALSPVAK